MNRPMSLNGYSWVEGNVVNRVDRLGRTPEWPYTGCEDKTSLAEFVRCRAQTVGNPCPIGWTDVSDSFHYLCQKDGVVMAPENAWTGTTPPRSHQELLLFTAAGLAGIPSLAGALGTGVSAAASAVSGWHPLVKAGLLGAELGFNLGFIGETSDNLKDGMTFWDAVSYSNIDWGRVAKDTFYGGVNGGIAVSGGLTSQLVASTFTLFGDLIHGNLSGEEFNFFNTVESALSNSAWFYAGGQVNSLLSQLPFTKIQKAIAYGLFGSSLFATQSIVDNALVPDSSDNNTSIALGALNATNIIPLLGTRFGGYPWGFALGVVAEAILSESTSSNCDK